MVLGSVDLRTNGASGRSCIGRYSAREVFGLLALHGCVVANGL